MILRIGKPIIFLIGFALIIVLSILWIISIISFFWAIPFAGYFFTGPTAVSALALTNIFVFFGVPVFALLMAISRRLFSKSLNPRWKAGMWALWLLNTVSMVMLGISQVREFNNHAEVSKIVDLQTFGPDTLYLESLSDPSQRSIITIGDLKLGDDELKSSQIHINVQKSNSDHFELIEKREARGRRVQTAQDLASAIQYDIIVSDNTISFPYAFSIPKGKKWRGQDVQYILKVPVGKTVKLDHEMSRRVWSFSKNNDVEQPWVHGGQHFWTMEDKGMMAHEYLKKMQDDRDFNFKNFEDIQVDGMVKVNITQGDEFSITINGKPKYTKKVDVVKLDKLLSITTDMDYHTPYATVEITLPKLRSLDLEKTGRVNISGFTQSDMMLKSSSRFEVSALVNVEDLVVKQDGRSRVKIRGKGNILKATVNRDARLDTERFPVKVADIRIDNNGRAEMAVSDTLRTYTNSHGHHHLRVDGQPVVLKDGEIADLEEFVIDH